MRTKKRHRYRERRKKEQRESIIKRLGALNIALICVFAYLIIINLQMMDLYQRCGSAPESAWCALIAALIGECGICGWIKTSKEKHGSGQPAGPVETGPPKEVAGDPEEMENNEEDEGNDD